MHTYRDADGDFDHYLVIASFVWTLTVKWRNKKQLNDAVKLDRDKLKNSNENRLYKTKTLTQTLNKYGRNQGDKEKISVKSTIKKFVANAVENVRPKI